MKEGISHTAIIMDGNRRWAKEHGLAKHKGHSYGAQRVEPAVTFAAEEGIKNITFWSYSTENQKRPPVEQMALRKIFREKLKGEEMDRMIDNGAQIRFIGDLSFFPKDIQELAQDASERSKNNNRITVALAMNYGGRDEIVRAVQELFDEGIKNRTQITPEAISAHLDTAGMPDPELVIRTGMGTKETIRTSGFMPWQTQESEWFFTETKWPDFDEKKFAEAITLFKKSERRFGK